MNDLDLYKSLIESKSTFWSPEYVDVSAWTEHIPFAFWLVETLRPKIIVELGVHTGNSYFSFCQAVKNLNNETVCYGVDTWAGDEHAGFYSDEIRKKVMGYNAGRYSAFSTLIQSTFDEAVEYFIDHTIDLLHIDGLHTYDAVKHDFENWLPRLSPDAVVLFHDINVREREFGVFRLWNELKEQYKNFQFDFGHGLGVLCLGNPPEGQLATLFNESTPSPYYNFLRNLFAERGSFFLSAYRSSLTEQYTAGLVSSIQAMNAQLGQVELSYDLDNAERDKLANKTVEQALTRLQSGIAELVPNQQVLAKLQASDRAYEQIVTELEAKLSLDEKRKGMTDAHVKNIEFQLNEEKQKRIEEEQIRIQEEHKRVEAEAKLKAQENEAGDKWAKELRARLERSVAQVGVLTSELAVKKAHLDKLAKSVDELQKSVTWYRNTYEYRSLLGIIKQKLAHRVKKKISEPQTAIAAAATRPLAPKHQYTLVPANNIVVHAGENVYSCSGADPYFLVETDGRRFRAGWYLLMIEFEDVKGTAHRNKIYFDYGNGFTEEEARYLPAANGGKIERLFHFPNDVTGLRFDPGIEKSTSRIGSLRLMPLSKFRAMRIAVEKYRELNLPEASYLRVFAGLTGDFLRRGPNSVQKKLRDLIYNPEAFAESYAEWVDHFDTVEDGDVIRIRELIARLKNKPLLSVVMPVYNAPVIYLERAIESVRKQIYENWEFCIADDHSTDPEVHVVLEKYQRLDKRIKVVFRETNGHISHASNSALDLATGEYMVLLDQDDAIPLHAMYMIAKELEQYPDAGIIYSDEDKIDANDQRFNPYFKTDWNKDLFYGQNMISHLGVYKLDLVRKVGGFRPGLEGSQDYDLAFRCIEHLQPSQIRHIPHVLYHWRAIHGSTALNISSKNYAVEAGFRALTEHLSRAGLSAIAVENFYNSHRVKWKLPDPVPRASIIIPTKDKLDVLKACITSLSDNTDYPDFEVLVIDNRSEKQETIQYFLHIQEQYPFIRVISFDSEFNFSAMVNLGVKESTGEVMVLLNNDTEAINEDWLTEMVSQAIRPDIGAVGAKLFYPNGQVQHAGVILYGTHPGNHIYIKRERDDPGYFNKLNLVQNYSAVTAACLAVRKSVYLAAEGFDEKNLKIAYNDIDFCLRLGKLGYTNIWTPFAQLFHYESVSRGGYDDEILSERFWKEHQYMVDQWPDVLAHDPYFNPNLNINTYTSGTAFPPRITYEWQTAPAK